MDSLIEKASAFALERHEHHKRRYTGEPYFNHLAGVARLVRRLTTDEEVIAAAYLHDSVEDTETTLDEVRALFGDRVCRIVDELTDHFTPEAYPKLNRAERKKREATRLGGVSYDAKLVKICDILDNASSIDQHDPKFALVWRAEKEATLRAMLGK
jgi:(p)ppGpp synthase/HD superfamily hydrolase